MTSQQLKAPITTQDLNHSVLTLIWQLAGLALVVVIAVVFLSSKWPKQVADHSTTVSKPTTANEPTATIAEPTLYEHTTPQPASSEEIVVKPESIDQLQDDVLYSGKLRNRVVVFTKLTEGGFDEQTKTKMVYTHPSRNKSEQVDGGPVEFDQIKDIEVIKRFDNDFFEFINFLPSDDEKKIWISYTKKTADGGRNGLIEHVSIDGSENLQVWNFEQCHNCYEYADPSALLLEQPDKSHLAFILANCYGCMPTWHAYVILNTETGTYAYLEMIGDVKFNRAAKTVSYRLINEVEEICPTNSPFCSPGELWKVDRPTGEVITESLP